MSEQKATVRNNVAEKSTAIAGLEHPPGNMSLQHLVGPTASPALQIMLDPQMYEKAKHIAGMLSKARGFTPKHLIDCNEACFAVVIRSLTWKLDPFAVAQSTFQIPNSDKVGYEGKLVQAIIENSGKVEGGVRFEYFGDWDKIEGKFQIKKNDRGREYPSPAWPKENEEGLGVIVSCQVTGEAERREFRFYLKQAYPRNSTLWATDPKTQLGYTAVRRFASTSVPGLVMGVPFDTDDMRVVGTGSLSDEPPRPERGDFQVFDNDELAQTVDAAIAEEEETDQGDLYEVVDGHHETYSFAHAHEAVDKLLELIDERMATLEDNADLVKRIEDEGFAELVAMLAQPESDPEPEPEKPKASTGKGKTSSKPATTSTDAGDGPPPAQEGDPGPQADMLGEKPKPQQEGKTPSAPDFDKRPDAWVEWFIERLKLAGTSADLGAFRNAHGATLDKLLKKDIGLYNQVTDALADKLGKLHE